MDYAAMPPEVNSARMYSGPGSASLMAAATAWNQLADGLDKTADGFRSVTTRLTGGWQGHAAIAMTQAAVPYLGWLHAAAAKGEQTAAHAMAAASAYEDAHAAVVPPAVIAANRSRRMLVATENPLGQDSESIAAMDADYEQMWAQDVEAMYSYADAAAAASRVSPFTSAPLAIDLPALARQPAVADPEMVTAGSQLISSLPQVLQALASSPSAAFDAALVTVSSSLTRLTSLAAPVKFPMHLLNFLGRGRKPARPVTVVARWGGAGRIGRLSVPLVWSRIEPPSPVSVDFRAGRRMRMIGGHAVCARLVCS